MFRNLLLFLIRNLEKQNLLCTSISYLEGDNIQGDLF
jgi:hypothetical protein